MAKYPEDRGTPEQYEETVDPANPPARSVEPAARVVGISYYLGPLALLVLVLAFAGWFMLGGTPMITDEGREEPGAAATTGQETPGLFGPDLRPDDTQEELEYRGAGGSGAGTSAALEDGQDVRLDNVAVVEVLNDGMFSIEHRGERVTVAAPRGAPSVRAGMRVDVSGMVESDNRGGVRIAATRVTTR